jgi:hydroxypyruvate reductase
MAGAVAEMFPDAVGQALVAGPPRQLAQLPRSWEFIEGAHPRPDRASVRAGQRALELARSGDPLIVLLSGGASSMLALPVPGMSLDDKRNAIQALMHAGLGIAELNCVRKHLSAIKGGRLGAVAGRALTLAISDVHYPVEDDPSVVASGPSVPDPSTYGEALAIARRVDGMPPSVIRHLDRGVAGLVEETIKPGDPRLAQSEVHVIGNRHTALAGAAATARALGYHVQEIADAVHGEARDAAVRFMADARARLTDKARPACVLAAGETTVTVKGRGHGGRNQEFALAVASLLPAFAESAVLASAGTDGTDGPTDAAGAIADSTTVERAHAAGLDLAASLRDNNAYPFFASLGDLIISGPTGTNVGDVVVLLVE